MEARKITIISTTAQTKKVIMSEAETLGQLKQDLNTAGIDYDGMSFFEGTSRTELLTDESVLPKDVPYTNRTTGETKNTNELVFMLTNSNKKIKSGAVRKELYETVKKLHLQEQCIKKYGRNYTQVTNTELANLVDSVKKNTAKSCPSPKVNSDIPTMTFNTPERQAIYTITNCLLEKGVLSTKEVYYIFNLFKVESSKVESSPYSDEEIDDMFNSMCD